jgi:hypothetical protein
MEEQMWQSGGDGQKLKGAREGKGKGEKKKKFDFQTRLGS